MDGAFGSGVYKCEITAENPSFVTLELKKNITVIGIFSVDTITYQFHIYQR